MQETGISSRITRAARALRFGVAAVAVALPAMAIAAALFPGRHGDVSVRVEAGDLPHLWASLVALVLAGLVAWALAELVRMLARVERGTIFAPATTRHFRRFALLLLIAALTALALPSAVSLALAWTQARNATLTLEGHDLLAALLALVFFFVARLFDEAARFEEDSRSIV